MAGASTSISATVSWVFGAPIAHGDDAERAVRAALAISAAIPDVSVRVGRPIGIHIGVAGGQVVASRTGSANHSEYTVTDDTVNLASRLTAAAKEGEILASDDTRRALAERFDCVDAGALDIKGFAEPVRAWRLLGLGLVARDERPFVGRHGEHRLSEAVLTACREKGRGQTIFIRGEAGIGKTRLIEEVQRKATESGFACHAALVLDFGGGVGRDAVRVLARSLLGVEVTSDTEAVRAAAARALSSGLMASEDAVFLNDLLNLPQPSELRPIYEAMDTGTRNRGQLDLVARILDRKTRLRPRLLVVERPALGRSVGTDAIGPIDDCGGAVPRYLDHDI